MREEVGDQKMADGASAWKVSSPLVSTASWQESKGMKSLETVHECDLDVAENVGDIDTLAGKSKSWLRLP